MKLIYFIIFCFLQPLLYGCSEDSSNSRPTTFPLSSKIAPGSTATGHFQHTIFLSSYQGAETVFEAIKKGHITNGMSQAEAFDGLKTILAAITAFDKVPEISALQGQSIRMRDKKSYFSSQKTEFSATQEEKLLSGILGLILGGNLTSGIYGKGMDTASVRRGIGILDTFVLKSKEKGVVLASYDSFRLFGDRQAIIDKAGEIAVACHLQGIACKIALR